MSRIEARNKIIVWLHDEQGDSGAYIRLRNEDGKLNEVNLDGDFDFESLMDRLGVEK